MLSNPETLRDSYDRLAAEHGWQADPAQLAALTELQAFADRLKVYRPSARSWLGLGKRTAMDGPQGLYIYGDVGRGKSMLMDLFFDQVQVEKKRRVHFHQFMLEIHARLHELQAEHLDDIMPALADGIAADAWLLCFDEFHVGNIADAMILGRLFDALFAAGVVIVSTSNWAPDDLYKDGLQRERFLPFIDRIKQKMIVYRLDGATDHRFEQVSQLQAYFWPLGEETTRKLQGIFYQLTENAEPDPLTLQVQSRVFTITHAAKGVGFFNYDELCPVPLGAADYLAIAKCLHTVLLDGVPKFTPERKNEIARFITLIDTLYEAHVKFFMAAEAPPAELAPETGSYDFVYKRTLSRLMEMQGNDYRRQKHLD